MMRSSGRKKYLLSTTRIPSKKSDKRLHSGRYLIKSRTLFESEEDESRFVHTTFHSVELSKDSETEMETVKVSVNLLQSERDIVQIEIWTLGMRFYSLQLFRKLRTLF